MEASNWISLGAVAISIAALCVSLFESVVNRPKLRLSAGYGAVGGAGGGQLYLIVSATNSGRQPTTIRRIEIVSPNLKFVIGLRPAEIGLALPHVLEVGRAADFLFSLDREIIDPSENGLSGPLSSFTSLGPFRVKVYDSWRDKPHLVEPN